MITSLCLIALAIQAKTPVLVNGGFDDGLSGWKAEGDARVADKILSFGEGKGAVRQKYIVSGLQVLFLTGTLKPSTKDGEIRLRLQCFDKKDHVLMDLTGGPGKDDVAAIYLKTQAHTAYVIVSIEKPKEGGSATADDVKLADDGKGRVVHKPEIDLDVAMRPFWKGAKVTNESALLISNGGGTPTGRLLFKPSKILSVRDSTLKQEFLEGKDFTIQGKTIIATKGTKMPVMSDAEFAKGQYPWTELQGRHVFVTYEHKDVWNGPIPAYQGDHLSGTVSKLKAKKPLTVVAYGDSITLGINVSGFRNVPPYLPPWPSLFSRHLGKVYGSKITLYNTALGGMTSQWAKDNAHDAVATLRPDLVLLAFGMNDFWSLEPKYFIDNIRATVETIRKVNPQCEFLLVGSMKFDPAYTTEEPYVGNLAGYPAELKKLIGKGIGLFDMTELSDALYKAKSQKDLATDPMHPDDFLARIYAQGAVAALVKS